MINITELVPNFAYLLADNRLNKLDEPALNDLLFRATTDGDFTTLLVKM